MTLTSERPWRKAKRFFEEHFKGETFAETVIKNLEGGLIYSDGECFVLAQEAESLGSHLDFNSKTTNAWYVQLAASTKPKSLSGIVAALRPKKQFICFKRGAKSDRLKCYPWDRFARKVGL